MSKTLVIAISYLAVCGGSFMLGYGCQTEWINNSADNLFWSIRDRGVVYQANVNDKNAAQLLFPTLGALNAYKKLRTEGDNTGRIYNPREALKAVNEHFIKLQLEADKKAQADGG